MVVRLSRSKLSRYYATSLFNGVDAKKLAMQLAAYLIESKRVRELQMIISDIEYQLSLHGVISADITSAHELDDLTKKAVIDMVRKNTGATSIELKEYVDPSILGGVKIKFIGNELDTTITRRLTLLKTNYKK